MWLYVKTMFILVSSFLEQSDAVVRRCSSEQMCLKIAKIQVFSQANTSIIVSFF